MKKLFVICAALCALASCESNFLSDVKYKKLDTEIKVQELRKSADFQLVCMEIITCHMEIEVFYELVPEHLRNKPLVEWELPEMVKIILTWNSDEQCGDVLCEYTQMDEFWELLPAKYRR